MAKFVPQMHVNLEELFPSRNFSPHMLYRMRDKFLKDKYGADGHDLTDLFTKAETIKHLDHALILLLQRMNILDKNIFVGQF